MSSLLLKGLKVEVLAIWVMATLLPPVSIVASLPLKGLLRALLLVVLGSAFVWIPEYNASCEWGFVVKA